MSDMDQIFATLPEETKRQVLAQAAMRRGGAGAGQYETAAQFNARQDAPLVYLVDGLLARGQLIMLGGRSKAGKSWLVAQLAQALDTGQPFLGRPAKASRVLYLPLEDKWARMKRRAEMLGWRPQTTSFLWSIGRFNAPNNALGPGLALIEQLAQDFDVILIDTLIATLDGNISENDNTSMGAIVNELANISHGLGCAIVLVHHISKGMSDDVFNLLRGASSLRGAYDVGLMLDRRQGEREAVLHVEARDFEMGGLTIRQRDNGGGWDVVGEAKAIAQIRTSRKVIEVLAEMGGGLTADELTEMLGISRQAVGQQLTLAEKSKTVVRVPGKREAGSRGRPKDIWFLPNHLPEGDEFMQGMLVGGSV